jgi:hypothetical protein
MTSHSLLKAQLRTVHVRTVLRPVLEGSHGVGKNDHLRQPNTMIVANIKSLYTTVKSLQLGLGVSYCGESAFLYHFAVLQPIIMQRPKLRYLPASSRCILQVTPGYRTPRGYRVSGLCFSEVG